MAMLMEIGSAVNAVQTYSTGAPGPLSKCERQNATCRTTGSSGDWQQKWQ